MRPNKAHQAPLYDAGISHVCRRHHLCNKAHNLWRDERNYHYHQLKNMIKLCKCQKYIKKNLAINNYFFYLLFFLLSLLLSASMPPCYTRCHGHPLVPLCISLLVPSFWCPGAIGNWNTLRVEGPGYNSQWGEYKFDFYFFKQFSFKEGFCTILTILNLNLK